MSVGFYMDEHFPKSITQTLRRRGVDVITAQEDHRQETDDTVLLKRATELRRVFVTQDADFLRISAFCHENDIYFSGIIFAPQNQAFTGRYIQDLEDIAFATAPEEWGNRVDYLPL